MKFKLNTPFKIKPLVYIIVALIGLYFIFFSLQKAKAGERNRQNVSNSRNNSRDRSNSRRNTNQRSANTANQTSAQTQSNSTNTTNQTSAQTQGNSSNTREQNVGQSQTNTTNQNQGNRTSRSGISDFRRQYDAAGSNERDRINQTSSSYGFFEIVFVLLIIGTIAFLFYKYVAKKRGKTSSTTDYISILATAPLSTTKNLQIVQIFDRVYVLGVGDTNINLITEITDPDLITQIRSDALNRLPSLSFKEQIIKVFNKVRTGTNTGANPENDALSFFEKQRNKIRNIKNNDRDH